MRTTLELDDDLILVGERLADQRNATLGRVVSDLVRLALTPGNEPRVRNGGPLFKANEWCPGSREAPRPTSL